MHPFDREGVSVRSLLSVKRPERKGHERSPIKGAALETCGHAITLVKRPWVIISFDREGVSVRSPIKGPALETCGHAITLVRRPWAIISFDREGVSVRSLLSVRRPERKGHERSPIKGPALETCGHVITLVRRPWVIILSITKVSQ